MVVNSTPEDCRISHRHLMDFPRAVDQLALFRGVFFGTNLACAMEPVCLDSTLVYHRSVFLVSGNDVSAGSRTHPRRGQSLDVFCPLSIADGFLQYHGIRALWGRQTSSHEQSTSHFRTHTASAQSARRLAGGPSRAAFFSSQDVEIPLSSDLLADGGRSSGDHCLGYLVGLALCRHQKSYWCFPVVDRGCLGFPTGSPRSPRSRVASVLVFDIRSRFGFLPACF